MRFLPVIPMKDAGRKWLSQIVVIVEHLRSTVDRLIREIYRPFDEIAELVRCFGEAALAVTEAPRAEVAIQKLADAAGLRISLGYGGPLQGPSSETAPFPIRYQVDDLGCLTIVRPLSLLGDVGTQACSWIAKDLAYHLKRHEVCRLARVWQGRDVSFIGTSEPLRRIDRFVEQASRTALPALILGSPGSEPERVALALHLVGAAREGAFVQVNCATLEISSFEQRLLELLQRADGGTLLFARLEDLDLRLQSLLCEVLEIGSSSWAVGKGGGPVVVRLLATATQKVDEQVARGELSSALLEQFDFLRLEIEPLRNRREDIPPLMEHYLRRHACGEVPEISSEVMAACVEYEWPGNVTELSRVVARLAVLAGDEPVELRHLRVYAPQILQEGNRAAVSEPPGRPASGRLAAPDVERHEALLARLESCHPALRRAIEHIGENYRQKLSLAEVAASAFVSSSHLAHLFQQDLGTSFTRYLGGLRIDHAKHLLLERPRDAITTIAAETGFSDLRNFERTFKGSVGCTPKEFRRLAGACRSCFPH
jgi:DNA-binding NtrC family response regulator